MTALIVPLPKHWLYDKEPDLTDWSLDLDLKWVEYKGVRWKARGLSVTGDSPEDIAQEVQSLRDSCPGGGPDKTSTHYWFMLAQRDPLSVTVVLGVHDRGPDTTQYPSLKSVLLGDIQEALANLDGEPPK